MPNPLFVSRDASLKSESPILRCPLPGLSCYVVSMMDECGRLGRIVVLMSGAEGRAREHTIQATVLPTYQQVG